MTSFPTRAEADTASMGPLDAGDLAGDMSAMALRGEEAQYDVALAWVAPVVGGEVVNPVARSFTRANWLVWEAPLRHHRSSGPGPTATSTTV